MDTLRKSRSEGGIGLIDLKIRNEAIEVMWLKEFLSLGPNRPVWAFVADVLLQHSILKKDSRPAQESRTFPFLQDWSVQTNKSSSLPEALV